MFILGRNRGAEHETLGHMWTKLPAYPELKALVIKVAKGELERGK
jgi:hypothetical protein